MSKGKSHRRWYQFSLRTMLVLVFLVSIPLAWVGYSLNWIKHRRQMLEDRSFFFMPSAMVIEAPAPCGLWLFGETGYAGLSCNQKEDIERARKLFPEAHIRWATVTK